MLAAKMDGATQAEEAARRFYVAGVEAQRARDQVVVPGLSPAAWAVLQAVDQAEEKVERGLKPGSVWNSLDVRMSPKVAEAWRRLALNLSYDPKLYLMSGRAVACLQQTCQARPCHGPP